MHWPEPATSEDFHVAFEKTFWNVVTGPWIDSALRSYEFSPNSIVLII